MVKLFACEARGLCSNTSLIISLSDWVSPALKLWYITEIKIVRET